MNSQRLIYLDRLKVWLTVLVVLHHTAITYGGEGGWYYYEHRSNMLTEAVLTLFTAVNQSFFMGLFFFISGYVTPASYDRKGGFLFLKDRIIRYGVPILGFMLIADPLLSYISTGYGGSFSAYLKDQVWAEPFRGVTEFEPGPLWFLFALLLFSIGYVVFRILNKNREASAVPKWTNRKLVIYLLLTGAANFLIRLWLPVGETVLSLQLAYFPAYIGLYIGGIAAYRGQWLQQFKAQTARKWIWVMAFVIIALPVVMVLGGALDGNIDAFKGGATWQSAFYSFSDPLLGLSISYVLLVKFRDRMNRNSKTSSWLSAQAYAAYILHPLVAVYFAYWLQGLDLFPLLKFMLVGVLVVPAVFVLASCIRKLPGAGRIL